MMIETLNCPARLIGIGKMTGCLPALLVLALVISLAAMPGCGSLHRPPKGFFPGGEDIELDLRVERPGRSHARYRVEQDGTLRFAGGQDVLMDRWTWTGRLTQDEARALEDLIAIHRLFARPPVSAGDEAEIAQRLTLQQGERSMRAEVHGPSPEIDPLRRLLEEASSRRNQPVLDSLPKANISDAYRGGPPGTPASEEGPAPERPD